MRRVVCLGASLALVALPRCARPWTGEVVDAITAQPIAGAVVTAPDALVTTDQTGTFQIPAAEGAVRVRAVGYRRAETPTRARRSGSTPPPAAT